MLDWSRKDLIRTISPISAELREADHPGERWSINGILKHIATAEWWYLERLGLAFLNKELEKEILARLVLTRDLFKKVLPEMEGSQQGIGRGGEIWRPRRAPPRPLRPE